MLIIVIVSHYLRLKKEYFFVTLLVTDVVRQGSLLAVAGDETFIDRVDYTEIEPGIYDLPGIVSRKEQLLPYLTQTLEKLSS